MGSFNIDEFINVNSIQKVYRETSEYLEVSLPEKEEIIADIEMKFKEFLNGGSDITPVEFFNLIKGNFD